MYIKKYVVIIKRKKLWEGLKKINFMIFVKYRKCLESFWIKVFNGWKKMVL